MDYTFRNIDQTTENNSIDNLVEGIKFNNFNSIDYGLWLTDRTAPTPSEQEITESIPYMQGVYDFSMLGTDRFFKNRDITYKFVVVNTEYEDRKALEQDIKRQLMPYGIQNLYDTHDKIYHWLGKCKSVTVDDDAKNYELTVSIVFDCYPFALRNNSDFDDVWDEVYFPHWIFQNAVYSVDKAQTITLYNIGSKSVSCGFKVDGSVSIDGVKYDAGTYNTGQLVLSMGANELKLDGKGTITFKFIREEMI